MILAGLPIRSQLVDKPFKPIFAPSFSLFSSWPVIRMPLDHQILSFRVTVKGGSADGLNENVSKHLDNGERQELQQEPAVHCSKGMRRCTRLQNMATSSWKSAGTRHNVPPHGTRAINHCLLSSPQGRGNSKASGL